MLSETELETIIRCDSAWLESTLARLLANTLPNQVL